MTSVNPVEPLFVPYLYERLYLLRDAYINLEVLLSPNCADSGNVRPVIYMINLEFDRLVTDIDKCRL